jgi:outer membrane usher protein
MSAEFTQLGMVPRQPPPIKLASFNLSYAALGGGSFGVAFAMQSNRSLTNVRIATCSYTIALRKIGSLGVSAMRNFEGVVNTTVFALLSISLSPTTGLSVTSQFTQEGKRPASPTVSATLQRNLSPGEGYGYRLQTRTDKSVETSYSQQNNSGTFSIDAAQYQGEISTRVNLSGGLAFLDHAAFMSRRIDQSFAVVQVADYSNVHLLADNQPAGKTNSAGKALIPNLRAYDINVISVDQRDLPIDAEISTLKVDAVPYFRSGIEINFPIKHSQGATFTVQLENGDHLPVGTRLTEVNTNSLYTVGFGGEVYIVGLSATSRMRANWGKLSCEFTINFKSFTEVLPDLGVFICKSVKPI